jgi:hypothetical protein
LRVAAREGRAAAGASVAPAGAAGTAGTSAAEFGVGVLRPGGVVADASAAVCGADGATGANGTNGADGVCIDAIGVAGATTGDTLAASGVAALSLVAMTRGVTTTVPPLAVLSRSGSAVSGPICPSPGRLVENGTVAPGAAQPHSSDSRARPAIWVEDMRRPYCKVRAPSVLQRTLPRPLAQA